MLQTDRQTDGRTTYDSNTALALCASRGNNNNRHDNVYVAIVIAQPLHEFDRFIR